MHLRAKLAAATLAATIIGGGALMPTLASAAPSNSLQSASKQAKLLAGGINVRTTATVVCDPNDQYHAVLSVSLAQTINGNVYYGYGYRDGSNGGWTCNGKAQTLNLTVFQSNSQPPFHKGTAVARFELYGSDSNGNWFDYSKRITVTVK
jgi:hypothetical protein